VNKLCTEFDGNRTIRDKAIDDLAHFSPTLRHSVTLAFDLLTLNVFSRSSAFKQTVCTEIEEMEQFAAELLNIYKLFASLRHAVTLTFDPIAYL